MAGAADLWLNRRMNVAALTQEDASLKALLAQAQAALAEHQVALAQSEEARRRLESIVSELRCEKFGAKSEKLSPDQYNLPLEDVEVAQGVLDAAQEKAEAIISGKPGAKTRNRGRLPAHLPRVERIIEPESTLCPCGCGEMAKIGEDVSERLDVVPAQLRVLVTRRPKYACRRCSGAVVEAHAPEHVVPGGGCPNFCVRDSVGVMLSDLSALRSESDPRTRSQTAPSRPSIQPAVSSGRRRCGSPGNPYDGHSLRTVIEETQKLTGREIERTCADKSLPRTRSGRYRGHDAPKPRSVFISGQRRGVFEFIKCELRRRSAIEPVIGHMKSDEHLGRNYLKGRAGDAANAILSAVGYKFRLVLAWLRALLRLICATLLALSTIRAAPNPAS
jgi:hypothetical protein